VKVVQSYLKTPDVAGAHAGVVGSPTGTAPQKLSITDPKLPIMEQVRAHEGVTDAQITEIETYLDGNPNVVPPDVAGAGAHAGVVGSLTGTAPQKLSITDLKLSIMEQVRAHKDVTPTQLTEIQKYLDENPDIEAIKVTMRFLSENPNVEEIADLVQLFYGKNQSLSDSDTLKILLPVLRDTCACLCYDQIDDQIWLGSFGGLQFNGISQIKKKRSIEQAYIVHLNHENWPLTESAEDTYFYVFSEDDNNGTEYPRYLQNVSIARDSTDRKTENTRPTQLLDVSLWFQAAFTEVEAAVGQGKTVFVSCSEGISRSSTFVIAMLMKFKGMTLKAAAELAIHKRPAVAPSWSFVVNILMPYEHYLRRICSITEADFINIITRERSQKATPKPEPITQFRKKLAELQAAAAAGAGAGAGTP
jgi:hypothetical protein